MGELEEFHRSANQEAYGIVSSLICSRSWDYESYDSVRLPYLTLNLI